jgi:hypothetical protein
MPPIDNTMGKDHLIPLLAVLILLTGCLSSLYVYSIQASTNSIQINGQEYTMNQLFSFTQPRVSSDRNISGIALDDLMVKTGVNSPQDHTYTLVGADGYQKTVTWENMKNGLLTRESSSVFSDLPKAFRVKDMIRIEVN